MLNKETCKKCYLGNPDFKGSAYPEVFEMNWEENDRVYCTSLHFTIKKGIPNAYLSINENIPDCCGYYLEQKLSEER